MIDQKLFGDAHIRKNEYSMNKFKHAFWKNFQFWNGGF